MGWLEGDPQRGGFSSSVRVPQRQLSAAGASGPERCTQGRPLGWAGYPWERRPLPATGLGPMASKSRQHFRRRAGRGSSFNQEHLEMAQLRRPSAGLQPCLLTQQGGSCCSLLAGGPPLPAARSPLACQGVSAWLSRQTATRSPAPCQVGPSVLGGRTTAVPLIQFV